MLLLDSPNRHPLESFKNITCRTRHPLQICPTGVVAATFCNDWFSSFTVGICQWDVGKLLGKDPACLTMVGQVAAVSSEKDKGPHMINHTLYFLFFSNSRVCFVGPLPSPSSRACVLDNPLCHCHHCCGRWKNMRLKTQVLWSAIFPISLLSMVFQSKEGAFH